MESNILCRPVKRLLSPPHMHSPTISDGHLNEATGEPQIRRITLKKSKEVKKKDSIASIVVDTKDSLKAPLIIETLDMEEDIEDDEEGDEKMRAKFLSKGDLPRSLRSTRRLSAFNEQLYEQQQLFLGQQQKKPLNHQRRRSSVSNSSEAKAASCDAIANQQKRTKGHKPVKVLVKLLYGVA